MGEHLIIVPHDMEETHSPGKGGGEELKLSHQITDKIHCLSMQGDEPTPAGSSVDLD